MIELFAVICWFVAGTAVWCLLHPDVNTRGFLRTAGTAGVGVGAVVMSSWGAGSGGLGAILTIVSLALICAAYWIDKAKAVVV